MTETIWEFREGDADHIDVQALVSEHLAHMRGQSPPESVHAIDIAALSGSDVRFVTAWSRGVLAGMGAYRLMGGQDAELKSMRTTEAVRGQGLGRALLHHLIDRARAEGIRTLWLETGSTESFAAARGLYLSEGFSRCPPFGDYIDDPESAFFSRRI